MHTLGTTIPTKSIQFKKNYNLKSLTPSIVSSKVSRLTWGVCSYLARVTLVASAVVWSTDHVIGDLRQGVGAVAERIRRHVHRCVLQDVWTARSTCKLEGNLGSTVRGQPGVNRERAIRINMGLKVRVQCGLNWVHTIIYSDPPSDGYPFDWSWEMVELPYWYSAELSTGRMDPRVGSGHDFVGFWRVGSGRVSTSDFLVVY